MARTDKPQTHRKLYENIKALLHEARNAVARNINTAMVMTYFEIGRMIVVDEQHGKKRAGYAEETLKNLTIDIRHQTVSRFFSNRFRRQCLPNLRQIRNTGALSIRI